MTLTVIPLESVMALQKRFPDIPMMDLKTALRHAAGDFEIAMEALRSGAPPRQGAESANPLKEEPSRSAKPDKHKKEDGKS